MENKIFKIGLLVIATGKYDQFVPPLFKSMKKHFLKNHDVTMFVFSDKEMPKKEGLIHIFQEHEGWPCATLKRYHVFNKNKEILSKMDYLYYCDADMLFVNDVGDEIIGELVATTHPRMAQGLQGTFEENPTSTAYVPKEKRKNYYAGGFNGGSSESFLKMSEHIRNNVDLDSSNSIIAVWHDESHLNRYLVDHKPAIELTPSYCYPESWDLPFEKKILALDKNHNQIRNG